jgi:hypothetical protein
MRPENSAGRGGRRPEYKQHPLWSRAMGLARDAYACAGDLRERDEKGARALRRAAVAVPAHVANALSASGTRRSEEALAARTALAEVAWRLADSSLRGRDELRGRADELGVAIAFELSASDGPVS